MTETLKQQIEEIKSGFDNISDDRKKDLHILSLFISERIQSKTDLVFICVHNSRRSHLSQIWAQVAAHHYGFDNIRTYSGGTEETCMYPKIAETLSSQGFQIKTLAVSENPIYSIKYDENEPAIIGFSKIFDDSFNPVSNFGAIMVCSAADSNCPFIATAAQRILLAFDDPKDFDGTDLQTEKYLERSKQIATELFYAFSMVER